MGTVCGLHIDAEGRVSSDLPEPPPCRPFRGRPGRIPLRMGVAAGIEKAAAVRGALRGGFVTSLVVDEEIAEAIDEEY